MSKRCIALLLVLVLTLAAGACGSGAPSPTPAAPTPAEGAPATEPTPGETAQELNWPTRPIQIVAPFAAGGDTDFNARMYANRLGDILGQPVIVTNVTGAAGAVGSREVLEADPDGYTILINHAAFLTNYAIGAIDFGLEDFEIAAIGGAHAGTLLAVNANSPFYTLQDLMDASAERPGELIWGNSLGGHVHAMGILFNRAGGAFNIVDSGDAAERVSLLLGGHVDVISNPIGHILPHIETGALRALAIIEYERNPFIPDIPTGIEQGFPGTAVPAYYFFAFPSGTPQEIVDRFADAMERIYQMEDYRAEIAEVFLQSPFFVRGEGVLDILNAQRELFLGMSEEFLAR